MSMQKRSSRILTSIVVAVAIIAGAGYYFISQKQQQAVKGLSQPFQKAGIKYTNIDCFGILSMKCEVTNASLKDGTTIKKIIFKNFEQFRDVKEKEAADLNLDIELKGIDAQNVDFKKKLMLFSMITGKKFSNTDFNKIEDIAKLLVHGNMFIKGNLLFKDSKLRKFKDFGFTYENSLIPFELKVDGSRSSSYRQDPINLYFTRIKFALDLKNKKDMFKKISKIMFPDKQLSDAELDERWDKFLAKSISGIEKRKKTEKSKLGIDALKTVENVLQGKKNMMTMIMTSKDKKGINTMDIIRNGKNNKQFLREHMNLRIEN